MRKNRASGARYTNDGIVCMKSSTGVMSALNRSLTPAQMPSGRPMSTQMTTAASVSASVSMLSCHRPSRPKNTKPTAVSSATRQLPNANASERRERDHAEPADQRNRPVGRRLADQVWMNVVNASMPARISLTK